MQPSAIKEPTAKAGLENRLASLDMLRGFDMFWIIGGAALVRSILACLDRPGLEPISRHLTHAEWAGFYAWDLIFPLFIFISGTTMPFSFAKYLNSGQTGRLYARVIRRAALLIVLGVLCNGLLRTLDFANLRYLSVLGLIGMAYLWASVVVIHFSPRGQAIGAATILLVYYFLMTFVPVPGHGAGVLTPEGNLASMIDRLLVPGTLHGGVTDPEGLLMTFPAAALAIAGALAGRLLKNQQVRPYRNCAMIVAAGVLCLLAGWGWGAFFPMIKKLWTSSFVVYAIGWSLLLLALFYLVIDIWKIRRVFFPFLLIGLNPLTIFILANRVIDFRFMANFFFGGLVRLADEPYKPIIANAGMLVCILVFLYILYRKKIFFRV